MEYAPLPATLWFLLFVPLLTEKEQGKRKRGVGAYSAVTAAQGAAGGYRGHCSRCQAWNVRSFF